MRKMLKRTQNHHYGNENCCLATEHKIEKHNIIWGLIATQRDIELY